MEHDADVLPFDVNTDAECHLYLDELKRDMILTDDEKELLEKCLSVVTSNDGDDIQFGPGEIIELSMMATLHPDKAHKIMACSHHLSESVEYFGEIPEEMSQMFNMMSDKTMNNLMMDVSDSDSDFEEDI